LDAARQIGGADAPLIYAWGRRPKVLAEGWEALQLPCGQCVGCRIERSKVWAIRCVHEASMHENNSFITLTYEEEPYGGTLVRHHFVDFMKRLRRELSPLRIRFFMCGEYGKKLSRPHYHALIFGYDFPDKFFWQRTNGFVIHRSAQLERLWEYGFSTIGDVTFETAAYCARYVMKKITGKNAEEHYERVVDGSGETISLEPEYITMSLGRKPGQGIGGSWYETYKRDCYPSDFITHKGKRFRVPRYYDSMYAQDEEEAFEAIKEDRVTRARLFEDNNTPARLEVREKCCEAKLAMLPRAYEDD